MSDPVEVFAAGGPRAIALRFLERFFATEDLVEAVACLCKVRFHIENGGIAFDTLGFSEVQIAEKLAELYEHSIQVN